MLVLELRRVSADESYDDLFVTSCNVSKMILNRHGYEDFVDGLCVLPPS